MRALRRINLHVLESGLDNYFCAGDLIPLHRDTKPWIKRAPAADADQKVGLMLGDKAFIEIHDFIGGIAAFCPLEVLHIHEHDVIKIACDSVA